MIAGFGINQLHVDPQAAAAALHRTLEHISNVQLAADLAHVGRLPLVGERGIAGDHERAANARQIRGQALGDAIDKIILLGIVADVHEGEDHDRKMRRRKRRLRRRGAGLRQHLRTRSIGDHGIGPHRPSDILEALLAEIGEPDADLAIDLIMGRSRQANAAGLRDALKPGRYVDAISEDVIRTDDDVADIDPDTKQNPLVLRIIDREFVDAVLKRHRSAHRFHRTLEFGKQPIAGVLDNPAAVRGDRRHHSVCQQCGHAGMRRLFVGMHQAGITGNIGHQYRSQPSFDVVAGNEALGVRIIHPSVSQLTPII
jgi:hypothetical protein